MNKINDNYKEILLNSIKQKKVGHFYIIVCNNINWCSYFTKWYIKTFLLNENPNLIKTKDNFISIDNEQYANLYIFKNEYKKTIGLEEIKKIKNWLELTPILDTRRFISLINCDYLTQKATNSLLKILEEPSGEITWFLFVENLNNIKDTLVSRAQIIYEKNFFPNTENFYDFIQQNINGSDHEEIKYILDKLECYAKKFFLYNDLIVADKVLVDLIKEKGNVIYKYFILLNEFLILNNQTIIIEELEKFKNLKKFINYTNIYIYIISLKVLEYTKYNLSTNISTTVFSLKLEELLKKKY